MEKLKSHLKHSREVALRYPSESVHDRLKAHARRKEDGGIRKTDTRRRCCHTGRTEKLPWVVTKKGRIEVI